MVDVDEIAQLSIAPILDRLSQRALEEMVDFCKSRCGHLPDDIINPCPAAKRTRRLFLMMLFREYVRTN